ncbi:hypothetical protein [Bacillus sp. WP8]|uniref:hypothetical protein n=1 Tax=Bacillus sp. WP8 TaxID=756828 RepID=UPI001642E30E|nr:hypothetical protein [Bacillus sp. WP8]
MDEVEMWVDEIEEWMDWLGVVVELGEGAFVGEIAGVDNCWRLIEEVGMIKVGVVFV